MNWRDEGKRHFLVRFELLLSSSYFFFLFPYSLKSIIYDCDVVEPSVGTQLSRDSRGTRELLVVPVSRMTCCVDLSNLLQNGQKNFFFFFFSYSPSLLVFYFILIFFMSRGLSHNVTWQEWKEGGRGLVILPLYLSHLVSVALIWLLLLPALCLRRGGKQSPCFGGRGQG